MFTSAGTTTVTVTATDDATPGNTITCDVDVTTTVNPNYFTNYWKSPNGNIYLFCYEFGFMFLKERNIEKYLLIEWQDYM